MIVSIKNRDTLYSKMKQQPPNSIEYFALRNRLSKFNAILKKLIRQCKLDYYSKMFDEYKSDIKKTWRTISEIICKNTRKDYFGQDFLIDGKLVSNLQLIANKFNEFFVGIGPKLASSITTEPGKSFDQYLSNPPACRFKFNLISEHDTQKMINSLRSKSSSGVDGISTKRLK